MMVRKGWTNPASMKKQKEMNKGRGISPADLLLLCFIKKPQGLIDHDLRRLLSSQSNSLLGFSPKFLPCHTISYSVRAPETVQHAPSPLYYLTYGGSL